MGRRGNCAFGLNRFIARARHKEHSDTVLFGRIELPPKYDTIGPWSEVKLAILKEYATPYSKIVSAKNFYHLYVDAFAGRGQHVSRTTGQVVPGSPLNALDTDPHFANTTSSTPTQIASRN